MDNAMRSQMKFNFKKGMKLSQYMQDMKSEQNQPTQDQLIDTSEDLYFYCDKNDWQTSTKLIPFNIPQMDQDNYQSSVDNYPQTPFKQQNTELIYSEKQTPKFRQSTLRKSDIQVTTMYPSKKSEIVGLGLGFQKPINKQFRIKHQSNSPFKRDLQLTPTKNILSKTLYGNTFLSNSLNTASSTLYQNKLGKLNDKLLQNIQCLKGTIHSRESKNQKYFQNKNKKQLDNLIHYENTIRNKFNSKMNLLDIRIDGFKDKLYQRKNKIIH